MTATQPYLSDGWLAALSAAEAAHGSVYAGPAATVEVRVAGGPNGPFVWHVRLAPGEPPRYETGGAPDAVVSYDQTWDDAVGQLDGRFDPCVAFMQGNLKVKGLTRPLYELFRVWASAPHRAAWADAQTTAQA